LKLKPINHTKLTASVICLGTSHIGSLISAEDSASILDAYTAGGGNFLDTAEVYANWLPIEPNSSERFLGQWMKKRGNRDRIIVATKGGHPRLDTPHISRLSQEDVRTDVEGSLKNLQTDYIDLYYLHRDDPSIPVETIVEMLEAHVRKGDIRYYACSNWTLERMEAARQYAALKGYTGFAAASNLWSLAELNAGAIKDPTQVATDSKLTAWHEQTGMALVPYGSQANGFFSGKYSKLQAQQSETAGSGVLKKYANDINFARLERVQQLARQMQTSSNQIALAYLLAQPFPVFPIVGCKTKLQLQDSLGAASIELDSAAVSYLSAVN
jgi:aryl-alcohol dehydrogenase-like predicted oxidoreductase